MKILLVQTSFLGDTILSTPVIAGIKAIYPESELWMMTTPLSSALVDNDPLLEGVIPFDKRNQYSGMAGLFKFAKIIRSYQFDKVYSLHKSIRTSALLFLSGIPERICFDVAKGSFLYHTKKKRLTDKHDVLRNLSLLSGEIKDEYLKSSMRLSPPAYESLSANLQSVIKPNDNYAVLVPGSAWATKMWHADGYRQTARFLVEKGLKVLLMGSADDDDCCKEIAGDNSKIINLAGKTTISEALYIMSKAQLAVCNDSMSLHMASAFKIPTIVIFCSTIPEFGYGPWENDKAIVIEKKMDCRPCGSHGKKTCPAGTNACMEEISHKEVISAIESIIKF